MMNKLLIPRQCENYSFGLQVKLKLFYFAVKTIIYPSYPHWPHGFSLKKLDLTGCFMCKKYTHKPSEI